MVLWIGVLAVPDAATAAALDCGGIGLGRACAGTGSRAGCGDGRIEAAGGPSDKPGIRPQFCGEVREACGRNKCQRNSRRCGNAAFSEQHILFSNCDSDAPSFALERAAESCFFGDLPGAPAWRGFPRVRDSGWVAAPPWAHSEHVCAG